MPDAPDPPETPDLALAALCRQQHSVFTWKQARDCGVRHGTIASRLEAGRYRSMLPGVLAEAGAPDTWEARAMAAQLAVGGDAALARATAARVLGLDVPDTIEDDRMHLLVRSRTFEGLPDLAVHRTRRLPDDHVTTVGPLRTTTTTRTICDLAGQLGPVALRRTVADAVRRHASSARDLRCMAHDLGRVRGKRQLLSLVDELSPLDADCRSELETRFLHVMRDGGLPPTAMNHPVTDASGRRRLIDAVYLPQRLPIELDSRRSHGTLLDWHDDLRRENDIVLVGWRAFLRFSWADVTQRPGAVVDTVRRALAA